MYITLLAFCIYNFCFHGRPKKFPPGPTNVPLVGSLLNVDVRNLSKSLSKLSKKYGDVFSLFVGRTPVVCLNSFETIKKCFEKNEFFGKKKKKKNLLNPFAPPACTS